MNLIYLYFSTTMLLQRLGFVKQNITRGERSSRMTQYQMPLSGDSLNPGLLNILRQAAWLRAALIALGIGLYVTLWHTRSAVPLLLVFAVERGLCGFGDQGVAR